MSVRRLTLTTVGLSIRDELRVKSMLQLVEGKTAATWTYIDEPQADLAICEPDSALARAVIKQATQRGRPRCVSLVRQGTEPLQDTQSVYAPLRVSDFISMLDATVALDGQPTTSLTTQQLMAAAQAEATANNEGFLLAHSLRDIVGTSPGKDTSQIHRITHKDVAIYVLPAQDSVYSNIELTPQAIADLSNLSSGLEVQHLPSNVLPAFDGGFHRRSMQYLLWHCGLSATATDLLPWLPRMARYRLRRWPDFGRLGHKPWQVRLTSLLMNEGYTLQQMTGVVQQPLMYIRSFLNACELSGLLLHEALPEMAGSAPMPEAPPASKGSSRWSGILKSIRQALHIGDE